MQLKIPVASDSYEHLVYWCNGNDDGAWSKQQECLNVIYHEKCFKNFIIIFEFVGERVFMLDIILKIITAFCKTTALLS